MKQLSMTFSSGMNDNLELQWDLYDHPVVDKWLAHIDEDASQDNFNLFGNTENTFCVSHEHAEQLWLPVREFAAKYMNARWATAPLSRASSGDLNKINLFAANMFQEHMRTDSGDSELIAHVLGCMKHLVFWTANRGKHDEGSTVWGKMQYRGTPAKSVDLTAEDVRHITTDVGFGDLYAITMCENYSWSQLAHFDSDLPADEEAAVFDLIENRQVGAPTRMTNGFYVPFFPDIVGTDLMLMNWFLPRHDKLVAAGSSMSQAISQTGRVPLGDLRTPLTDRMREQLTRVEHVIRVNLDEV